MLDVDVRCAQLDGVADDRVNELDDRRVNTCQCRLGLLLGLLDLLDADSLIASGRSVSETGLSSVPGGQKSGITSRLVAQPTRWMASWSSGFAIARCTVFPSAFTGRTLCSRQSFSGRMCIAFLSIPPGERST